MRFANIPTILALLSALTALLVVSVPAASAQATGWQPGPGAALDNTYDGFIDIPKDGASAPANGSFTVAGWFVDKTAQGWAGADDIEVWLGTMDGGGHMLAKAIFAQPRPDVANATGNPYWAASGFGAAINGASVPSGTQALYVYAHTPGKGWWWKSVNVAGGGAATGAAPAAPAAAPSSPGAGGAPVLSILNPTNNQDVSTKSTYVINGQVNDPSHVDRVDAWINGERGTKYASMLGTTTPNSDGSWSITFNPTKFPSTHSILYIYAHNTATGLETLVSVEINIVDK